MMEDKIKTNVMEIFDFSGGVGRLDGGELWSRRDLDKREAG